MATMPRGWRTIVAVCVLGYFAAIPASAPSPTITSHFAEPGVGSPALASPNTAVALPIGLVPTRSESDIRGMATSRLDQMAASAPKWGLQRATNALTIQSVATTRWSDVGAHESRASGPETGSAEASRIVWVVRAEGSFLVTRGRKPFVGASGYLLIDDETGMILGMGTP